MADLDAARRAFSAHEWGRARGLLLEVVAVDESDEALAMLGTASWWLDDGEAAVSARERQLKARRLAGDAAGRSKGETTTHDHT